MPGRLSFLSWEWIGPLSLLLALLGWLIGRVALPREHGWQRFRRVLLAVALCALSVWLAGYAAFFGTWLYWPALQVFGGSAPGGTASALQSAVLVQAGVMSVGVLALLRRRWVRWYPVAVFALVVFWFAGWLVTHPQAWAPSVS